MPDSQSLPSKPGLQVQLPSTLSQPTVFSGTQLQVSAQFSPYDPLSHSVNKNYIWNEGG